MLVKMVCVGGRVFVKVCMSIGMVDKGYEFVMVLRTQDIVVW